jgi:F-type H+-transporting ATPase subunit a
MNGGLHIALAAERLLTLWGIPVTNTLITAWVVIVFLIMVALFVGRHTSLVPGKVQSAFEMLFEFVLGYMEQTLGTRALAERFFPLIATLFLFIFTANMLDYFPLIGSLGFTQGSDFVPLFRPVNTDLNVTLALAIIVFLTIEISGMLALGVLKYASKFVSLRTGVMGLVVGLLEIIGNLARLVSFSFRLFGNIFAGEVLIAVISSFLPYLLPVPLMLFETFVGLLQSAIFALLTLVFIKLAIMEPHGEHQTDNEKLKTAH